MIWARGAVAGLALASIAISVTQGQTNQERRELMTLYFASIAADRCDFPLSETDADKIIRTASALQKKLGLNDAAADLLYEEVELAFEKKLPDACKKDGEAFKSYQQAIESVRKK